MTRTALFAALLVGACDTGETTCGEDPVTAACSADLDSRGACLDEGGCWGIWGLAPEPSCNCPTTDAGEPCDPAAATCEGLCLHFDYDGNGTCAQPAQGECSDMQQMYGCFCTWSEETGWTEICAD
jgi:hypothetical protein